ncbi:MAG: S41 family peptidase [Oscillospiraceae bacterium]|nr:S41 family peptidase [Oscillospiraceae bacterium]
MNKKVSLGLTISIAALTAAITFIVTSFFSLQNFNQKVQAVKEKAEKYERLEALDTFIRENYYTDLDEDALMNGMLKGYVAGLEDPYSVYLTAQEYSALLERESGQMVGIGVTVTQSEEGYIHVIEVQKNSPAEEAGVKVDDLITAVDGADVLETGYLESVDRVRGEEGTKVRLTVLRDGKELNLTSERRTFDTVTVESKLLDNHIGYIRITAFRENTPDQFSEAMEQLIANGADALVFDVRNNGGGLLNALESMLDPLLPEGVIATANYSDGESRTAVYSDASELDLPMAVLVNEGSASAAELFAASLRDFDKAELVGKTTFGKGVMQVTHPMEDGGGLTLTIATYQTTRSECYHGVGLIPEYEVEPGEDTVLGNPDPATDPQLAKAMEIVKN